MIISDFIKKLEEIREKDGDIEVLKRDGDSYYPVTVVHDKDLYGSFANVIFGIK